MAHISCATMEESPSYGLNLIVQIVIISICAIEKDGPSNIAKSLNKENSKHR